MSVVMAFDAFAELALLSPCVVHDVKYFFII